MEYHGVKGHSELVRDPTTNAIVNVDDNEYKKYVSRRASKVAQSQQTENIEQDLANLKNEMNEIKSLLKELVSSGH